MTVGGVGDRRRCDGAVSEKQQGSKTGLGSAPGAYRMGSRAKILVNTQYNVVVSVIADP